MTGAPLFAYLADDGEFPAFLDLMPGAAGGVGLRVRGRERLVNGEPVDGAVAELELGADQVAALERAIARYLRGAVGAGDVTFDREVGVVSVAGVDPVRFRGHELKAFRLLWPTLADQNATVEIGALAEALPTSRAVAYSVVQSIRAKLMRTPLCVKNIPCLGYRLARAAKA